MGGGGGGSGIIGAARGGFSNEFDVDSLVSEGAGSEKKLVVLKGTLLRGSAGREGVLIFSCPILSCLLFLL